MVVGDSVARSLVPGLRSIGIPATNRSIVGCSLVPGFAIDHAPLPQISCGQLRSYIAQVHPSYVLVISGIHEIADVRKTSTSTLLRVGTPAFAAYYDTSIQRALDDLRSSGATVIFPTVPCIDGKNLSPREKTQTPANPTHLAIENRLLNTLLAQPRNRNVLHPDLRAHLCPHGFDATLRPDGDHFNAAGATNVANWLAHQYPDLKRTNGASAQDQLADRLNTSSRQFCAFGPVAPPVTLYATCRRENPPAAVRLRVFTTARERDRVARLAVAVFCKQLGATTYATGGTWLLTGDTADVTDNARILHGQITTAHC